ncbi:MAG: hypothetical protein E7058_02460 [Lentisphaerae bacterium]|nr:hypothetical protein [Lentisphaerota bacterium]
MKKTILFPLMAAVLATLTAGAETYTYNTPGNWRRSKDFIPVADGVLQIKASAHETARNTVNVDPEKSYKVSMKIRLQGTVPSQVYLLAMPISEEGRTIQMYHVTPVTGSDGVLAADCTKNDTFIIVKPDSRRHWSPIRSWRVHFNSAKDASDLPNYDVSNNLDKIEDTADGNIKVSFRGKALVDAKAGTPVRLTQGGAYMYLAGIKPTAQWTEVSGTVKGINNNGWSNNVFPVGTASFAPALLANWGTKGAVIEIKDFKVEEI